MPQQGDQVYVASPGSWDTRFNVGTVVKVTPSGLVDVQTYPNGPATRFNTNGYEAGNAGSKYRKYLDTHMSFEERKALLEREERTKAAMQAISEIKVEERLNWRWGKERMAEEVARLQGLLNAAKAAVDAV